MCVALFFLRCFISLFIYFFIYGFCSVFISYFCCFFHYFFHYSASLSLSLPLSVAFYSVICFLSVMQRLFCSLFLSFFLYLFKYVFVIYSCCFRFITCFLQYFFLTFLKSALLLGMEVYQYPTLSWCVLAPTHVLESKTKSNNKGSNEAAVRLETSVHKN